MRAGNGPASVAVSPDGGFVSVANRFSDNVSVFRLDADTGTLSGGERVRAGDGPVSVAVSPDGGFVLVANFNSDDVSVFRLDADTGTLSGGERVRAGDGPLSVAVSPDGFVLVVNFNSDGVSFLRPDPAFGLSASPATGRSPQTITVHPSGEFCLVTNLSPHNPMDPFRRGSVSIHRIDSSRGALQPFLNPRFVDAGEGPFALAIAPGGKHVYVANLFSDDVAVFHIDEDSCFDQDEGATSCLSLMDIVPVGITPADIKLTAEGSQAYVANFDSDSISIFNRDSNTGQLSLKGQVQAGPGPFNLGIDSEGSFLYVANFKSDTVSQYEILPGGDLMPTQTLEQCTADSAKNCTGQSPMAVALVDQARDDQKGFLYVANAGSNTISQYKVSGDGTLNSLEPPSVPTGAGPVALAVDPAGDFLYVSNLGANTVSMYQIQADGQLSLQTTAPAGLAPRGLAVFAPATVGLGGLDQDSSTEPFRTR